MFAYQHSGIEPDIMTLGKGIGGGVPLSALCAKEEVSVFVHGDQGGTYNGNPLVTAAGIAVFDTLTAEGFFDQVQNRAQQLATRLQGLSDKWGFKGERGLGLLRALKLDKDDAGAIVETARSLQPHRLLLNAARPNLLRFMPALNLSEEDLIMAIELLDEAIAQHR